jgi:hypothetical protein
MIFPVPGYSITQALRDKLKAQGTLVVSVHPGPVATDMADSAGLGAVAEPASLVADGIVAALGAGEFEEVYAVRLVNDADFDAAVSLAIDGLSLFVVCDNSARDPKTGRPLYSHVIVPRKGSLLVRGWFVNLEQSDEFKVTRYAKSLAAELKSSAPTGQVTACFHAAVKKDEKLPPGEPAERTHAFDASATGRGARFERKYRVAERKIGGLRVQVSVRYTKAP